MLVEKRKQLEAEEQTRSQILRQKQETQHTIMGKASNLERIRKLANSQAQLRKQNKVTARCAAEQLRQKVCTFQACVCSIATSMSHLYCQRHGALYRSYTSPCVQTSAKVCTF